MKFFKNHVLNTYNRLPLSFERGEGVWLFDKSGKKYLDALSGVAVNTLGHNHHELIKVISKQASKLIHVSNYYHIEEQCLLAAKLASISTLDSVFFCNSGCEANEAAIKFARLFGHKNGNDAPNIIVMERAFHGRTMATLTATGSRKVQAGFEPLVPGFIRVPFDDIEAIQHIADKKNKVVAIMVEPIQGEGGINIANDMKSYLESLRKICDENNWLLMFDEVQCGIGRTGKWFAYQYSDVKPDVLMLAKGLASGVPIGACVVNDKVASVVSAGKHGSTFGGNPLACIAGLTTLKSVEKENLLENAFEQGAFIVETLAKNLSSRREIISIRNMGLMIGIELNQACNDIVKFGLDEGILINVTADKVIRLLPPLIINRGEATILTTILTKVIQDFLERR
ncbi:MAG: aspartate aminotransferase family protein [Methylophilaceae bacterium]